MFPLKMVDLSIVFCDSLPEGTISNPPRKAHICPPGHEAFEGARFSESLSERSDAAEISVATKGVAEISQKPGWKAGHCRNVLV